MHPVKRWEMAVEIVDRVRSGGLEPSLTLINHPLDQAYGSRITEAAATRPWFQVLTGLTREERDFEGGANYGLRH
jgi:hypothetical protein